MDVHRLRDWTRVFVYSCKGKYCLKLGICLDPFLEFDRTASKLINPNKLRLRVNGIRLQDVLCPCFEFGVTRDG